MIRSSMPDEKKKGGEKFMGGGGRRGESLRQADGTEGNSSERNQSDYRLRARVEGSAEESLPKNSDANGVVAFVCGTLNYADLMNSFYFGSIRPNGIRNFIFVALTDDMCGMRVLNPAVPCVQYPRHYGTSKGAAISWGTARFAQVVQVKTDVLLGIVQEGFTGLLMDADIHLFRNPMPELAQLAEEERADMVIQDDMEGGRNSGFMYLRPSEEGAAFAVHVVGMQRRSRTLRQQEAVNRALRSFHMRHFRVFPLPQSSWPCGEAFFNKFARRIFAWSSACSDCIMVHNNWILGDDAKEYRAKEFLQWTVDSAGGGSMEQGYYTSSENRLSVSGLNSIQPSPERAFYIAARFQQVPTWGNKFQDEVPAQNTTVVRTSMQGIITKEEIQRNWGSYPDKILRFHSLYHVTVLDGDDLAFDKKWVKAMMHASIRQV
ncbi:hypothetical protein GUITHDRAFT_105641 [Guillardia theta CCMP2712]|uniref:Nucleotide-diphospho-sugar transferase domain-containing protein n=1 Tax=Guillardia theta (strain CCMP2712) TaxID=905079 RepID=L1JK83_GUITC|nr:hypothetical protein GUITHDRAFT_105641 [Guillardia theta CCMP2712]EKX48495.1 hypothetical protein GUITHDRAFT_105641 [Guillardia theta CCMP2712]|eukprot:XP_005835475.1 hypothetical protein GUITHDRAFT_105641 [Guillardia theta CCMP2712]